MLNENDVEVVRGLLAADISQREISRMTGISRDSIRRIFKGKWQVSPARAARVSFSDRIGRCPECGARVHLPCLACRVRRPRRLVERVA